MGEGRARGGGADSLRRSRTPSALQMPKCTKPELEDPLRASDLIGRETEAQGRCFPRAHSGQCSTDPGTLQSALWL